MFVINLKKSHYKIIFPKKFLWKCKKLFYQKFLLFEKNILNDKSYGFKKSNENISFKKHSWKNILKNYFYNYK